MQVRFLLGPAGSGKTFRCLTEVRHALTASPEGLPLLLVAPKQTTYQLERQFLAYPSIPGYTRLHILSFDRLAYFALDRLGKPAPEMLDEEGRLMVLRGLLARKRDDLKLFRASARLTGFAHQLSLVLRELQSNQLTPESLNDLAQQVQDNESLSYKLQDLATLLSDYLTWLKAHDLLDVDSLLATAAEALQGKESKPQNVESGARPKVDSGKRKAKIVAGQAEFWGDEIHAPRRPQPTSGTPGTTVRIEHLWVDGFADFSEQELELLAGIMPRCEQATITFCLDRLPAKRASWLSNWSVIHRTFEKCQKRFTSLVPGGLTVEILPRHPNKSRFLNNPVLQHLEQHWTNPKPYGSSNGASPQDVSVVSQGSNLEAPEKSLRVVTCLDPEAEVKLAAHEILRYARAGGRYRDVTVLVRTLEGYHQVLQRVFAQYEIPFFLDRRESVSHHPLAELTRSALRTVAFQWPRDDWFAALKTGLVPAEEV
ncbi:MAG TPA: hypothetical protein VEC99_03345, partial [Clostridia bacterium]|nr:hypothetical protein [Clostridia bacterium]